MSEFQPYFTNDGSVGLYSKNYDDIYHSASGALTEAYEKFIYPINWDILLLHDDIKILDICYGIGYNTKSFLNYIFENKKELIVRKNILKKIFSKNIDVEAIHTDNIIKGLKQIYTETVYTNNIFDNISVTAVDNDEILFGLSPFIKTGLKNFKNESSIIKRQNIEKYFKTKYKNIPKINNLINYQILIKIATKFPEIFQNSTILSILASKRYNKYLINDFKGLINLKLRLSSTRNKLINLHNIYYRYIANRYKRRLEGYNVQDFDFNIVIDDARNIIKNDTNLYNLIFLDAFTHSKCPCLWTYEFFKQLYSLLKNDGMLFTYSSAPQVRSAMKEAGFIIGNIYNQRLNKFQGTVAVKNESLIMYPLSETEIGLLNTKAGIFYRDKNLKAQNEAIINTHKIEVENSNLISSSQYLKSRRNNGL